MRESFQVKIPVAVVPKNLALFVAARNDVVQRTRKFEALDTRHQQPRWPNVELLSTFVASPLLQLDLPNLLANAAIQR
jgi:hypothetical protein